MIQNDIYTSLIHQTLQQTNIDNWKHVSFPDAFYWSWQIYKLSREYSTYEQRITGEIYYHAKQGLICINTWSLNRALILGGRSSLLLVLIISGRFSENPWGFSGFRSDSSAKPLFDVGQLPAPCAFSIVAQLEASKPQLTHCTTNSVEESARRATVPTWTVPACASSLRMVSNQVPLLFPHSRWEVLAMKHPWEALWRSCQDRNLKVDILVLGRSILPSTSGKRVSSATLAL